jgi:hypothetical protein
MLADVWEPISVTGVSRQSSANFPEGDFGFLWLHVDGLGHLTAEWRKVTELASDITHHVIS